jgi:outer membrane protein OmpA-like peptidoglycan-associated protein
MNALIDLGIEKSRLTAVGYGEDFPIAKDDKNGLSEVNRRVEIKVLGE